MKLRFLLGAGVGYVLGTRAGREQYERLTGAVRDLAGSDSVRNVRDQVARLTGGDAPSSSTQPSTPPLIAGPGPLAGTDPQALPGDDVGLDAASDPAGGGGDVILPDLESSTSRSRRPKTTRSATSDDQEQEPPATG